MHMWNLNIYFVIDTDVKIVSLREPEVVILNNDPYERVYKEFACWTSCVEEKYQYASIAVL